jgi:hypothetical protein
MRLRRDEPWATAPNTTPQGVTLWSRKVMQGGLLARRAGVHVDFHPYRNIGDLRCFPSHFRFSKVTVRPSFERRKLALFPI